MRKKMRMNFFVMCMLLSSTAAFTQDNHNTFGNSPYPIYKPDGQVTIAGDVSTFVYTNYFGSNVKKEKESDPHSSPERLVYELFRIMKNKDVERIGMLYDTTFKSEKFDENRMEEKLRTYDEIKFLSKFKCGDLLILRYDFVSASDQYSYFAVVRAIEGKYYLTMNLNVSDPFNVIGSLSPYNLFERTEQPVNTAGMTAFYFVERDNKVYFTAELPNEEYTAIYLAFDFYDESSNTPEIAFLRDIQRLAGSKDSAEIKDLIAPDQLSLLSDNYFNAYYYSELMKIFRNFTQISPAASLSINEGKVLYFKFSNKGQSENIGSIITKENNGKLYLSLRITDDDLNNVLQNVYVKEAIYNYFRSR